VLTVGNQPFAISDGRQHLLTLLSLRDMIALARTCHAWYATAAKPARRRDVVVFNCLRRYPCINHPPAMAHHVHTLFVGDGQYNTDTCFVYGHFFPCLRELHTRILLHDRPCRQCDNRPTFPATLTTLHIRIVNRVDEHLLDDGTAFINQIGRLSSLCQLTIDSKMERSWTLRVSWIRGLAHLTQLWFLNIMVEMDVEAIAQLGALTHLTDLRLHEYGWTVERLGILLNGTTIPPLRALAFNTSIGETYIQALRPLAPSLTTLDFNNYHFCFGTEEIGYLSLMYNLTSLDMSATDVEKSHVTQAFTNTRFANMKDLTLQFFTLDENDLRFAEIHWPLLTQLTLSECWTHTNLTQCTFPDMQVINMWNETNPAWTPEMRGRKFVGMPNLP
jgi:hypothetical protein